MPDFDMTHSWPGMRDRMMAYLMVLQKIVSEVLEEALQVFLLNLPLFQSCRQDSLPVVNDSVCTLWVFKYHSSLWDKAKYWQDTVLCKLEKLVL